MKVLKYIEITGDDGNMMDIRDPEKNLICMANSPELSVLALKNSRYKDEKERSVAFKVFEKLEDVKEDIELEDEEFRVLGEKVKAYEPFMVGFTFLPFMDLFKD